MWTVFVLITVFLQNCACLQDTSDDNHIFLLAFFPEATETHLFLTSCEPGSCNVSYDDGKRKTLTVQLHGEDVVPVDMSGATAMQYGVNVANRAVLVNCTVPASVYAYNYGHSYGKTDAYTGQPLAPDFTDYIVPSAEINAVLGVAALNPGTHVSVTLKSTCEYTFNGTTYKSGDVISLDLKALDVLSIGKIGSDKANQRTCDLGGTRITSNNPVAVYSGSTSLVVKDDGGHAMTQILPTSQWSMEFVVPSPQGDASGHVVRVTAGHDDTTVTIGVPGGGQTEQIHLSAGEHFDKGYSKESTVITSSKPVQVTQYVYNYFHSFENVIPGTDSYKTNYTATTMDRRNTEYKDFVNVVTTKGCENDIVMEGQTASTLSWASLGSSKYTVGSSSIPAGTFHAVSSSGNCSFSLQVYGYGKWTGEAYGYSAVLGCELKHTTTTESTTSTTFMTTPPTTYSTPKTETTTTTFAVLLPADTTMSTNYPKPSTFAIPRTVITTLSTTYPKPTTFAKPVSVVTTASTNYPTPKPKTPLPAVTTMSTKYPTPKTETTTTTFAMPLPAVTTMSTKYPTPKTETTTTTFAMPLPAVTTMSTKYPTPKTETTTTTFAIPVTEASTIATTYPTPTTETTPTITLRPEELLEKAVNLTCTAEGWDIDVDIDLLKQLYPNIDPNSVFLSDDLCQGHYDPADNMLRFHFKYGQCSTTMEETKNEIIYKNFLYNLDITANVIENIYWQYDLVCHLKRNEVDKIEYNPHVQVKLHGHGTGTVKGNEAKMVFFNDSAYQNEVKAKLNIDVGSTIYAEVVSPENEGNKIVVQDCSASPLPNGGNGGGQVNTSSYPLIQNKCAVDKSTMILDTQYHVFRFSFEALEFRKQHGDIFISCDVHLCKEHDYTPDCLQNCRH